MKRRADPAPQTETDEDPKITTADDVRRQQAQFDDATAALEIEKIIGSEEMLDGRCRITRRGQTDSDFVTIETVPVSTLKPDLYEFVSKRYGGGRYGLWFYLPSGEYHTKKSISIDFRIPEGEFFSQQRARADEPEPSAIDKLVDKITGRPEGENQAQTLMLTFLKMSQDQNVAMVNAMAQTTAQTLTAIANMAAALKGGATQAPGMNLLEALAVFDKLKAKDTSVDPIKVLELAHTWFRENQGEDEEPQWMKLVQALAPVLLGKGISPPQPPALPEGMPEKQPITPGPPERLVPGLPEQPPSVAPEAEAADPMNILFLVRMMKARLFEQIAAGAQPQDAVDLVFNPLLLTDDQFEKLDAILRDENWQRNVFGSALTPEQKTWLDEFRRLFLVELAEAGKAK